MDLCFTAQKNLLYGATMPNLWRVGLTLAAFFFCTQGMSFGPITPLVRGWNNPSYTLISGHSFAGILTPFTTSRGPPCSFVCAWSPNMHTGIQNAGTHQKILKLLKSQLQHYLFFPDVLRWMGNLEPETYKTSGSSLQQVGFWRRGRFQSPPGIPIETPWEPNLNSSCNRNLWSFPRCGAGSRLSFRSCTSKGGTTGALPQGAMFDRDFFGWDFWPTSVEGRKDNGDIPD